MYENYINQWDKGLWFPNEEELKKLKRYQEKFNEKILPTYGDLKNQVSSGSSARFTIEGEEKVSKEIKKTLDRLLLENDKPDTQKEQMVKLQARINALEQKQSQNPNSGDSEQTKQELARLKSELIVLKAKQNQQSDKNPQPNDFPWMAIGGGIVIVILLLIIAFLYKKSKKVN